MKKNTLNSKLFETVDLIRKLSFMKPSNPADILALSLSQKSLSLITKLSKIQEQLIIADVQKNNKEYKEEITYRFKETIKEFNYLKEEIKSFEIEYVEKIDERDKNRS